MLIQSISPFRVNNINNFKSKNTINNPINNSVNSLNQYSINNNYLINFNGTKNNQPSKNTLNNYLGCLLGGAIGDSFGSKIEAWSLKDIKETFGEMGLRNILTKNGVAKITDDTQMSLFSAYALIRTKLQNEGEILEDACIEELTEAYKDWYSTQEGVYNPKNKNNCLLEDLRLYKKCFPGVTCLEALEKENYGDLDNPINNSKGSGGVMRSAPIGLVLSDSAHLAFRIGAKSAALTHGHPDGYMPAGALSFMIAHIINGDDLSKAVNLTIKKLDSYKDGKNTAELLKKAVILSKENISDTEAIALLGKGFTGDEALSIALYCALKHQDNFKEALIASINHDGDSDTTGAITGNILGAYIGEENIPNKLKGKIELSDKIYQISSDLYSSIEEIKNPKENYGCYAKTADIEERRSDDKFNFQSKKIEFLDEDKKILKELPLQEALKYRSYLIENKKFKTV